MLRVAEYNTKTGKKIELKELEKYGFCYKKHTYINNIYESYDYVPNHSLSVIQIEINSREIYLIDNNKNDGLSKIYDLIKYGFVEKVDD